MAINYKYRRSTADTVRLKGTVNGPGTSVTYLAGDVEKTINVTDLFDNFKGKDINLVITTKEETDMLNG
jgi:hypothetical protein